MARAEADRTLSHLDHEIVAALTDFRDPNQEWRRLFSELLGTFGTPSDQGRTMRSGF
ncbi:MULTISPECIES: hypothetical protein [unclassified Bradyrhizobium]|uniref:hypothetical protein n=1 Tax=unclassified Bradyrhizobium TaxID=2631580 RepID=UPI000408A60B|nr:MULTISPECIES: hypothetical protein [unclassified Bradyrhizobium]MCP3465383.1 hypothetical protein [Bradyrhizobium sp. CCGUVB23]